MAVLFFSCLARKVTAVIIRPATEFDLVDLHAIYRDAVLKSTATFDTFVPSLEERRHWLLAHNKDNHPLLVADIDGRAAGYASLSEFNPKKAYAGTVELSVYIDAARRRRGLGLALSHAVIELARADPRTHRIVSLVTADNAASIRLHERLGFRFVGTLTEAGFKFGKYLDVIYFELAV